MRRAPITDGGCTDPTCAYRCEITLVEEERDRYREALIKCATVAGADVSDGPPTWPDVGVWAVRAVEELRRDYDDDFDPSALDEKQNSGGAS